MARIALIAAILAGMGYAWSAYGPGAGHGSGGGLGTRSFSDGVSGVGSAAAGAAKGLFR